LWVVLAFALSVACKSKPPSPEPLRVTGGGGPTGFSFTNLQGRLSQCVVGADDGSGEWIAHVSADVAPSETVSLPWSDFKLNGQPLPAYLGRAALVTVNCDTGDGRHFATFRRER
jgi:hypothetical protein